MEASHRVVKYSGSQKDLELESDHNLDIIHKHLNYYVKVTFKIIIESVA